VLFGYGEYSFANGDIFKGFFEDGMRQGKGEVVFGEEE